MNRRWFALGVLTMAVLLIGIDGTVLALATPFISADLGTTGTQLLWIGDIYSFCLLYTSPSPRDGLLSRMPSSA